jgi:hypothetical protein
MTAAAQFIFIYILFKGFKINTYLLACGKQISAFGEYKYLGHTMHYSPGGWKETGMYSNNQYESRFAMTAVQKGFQHCTFNLFCLFVYF